MTYSNTMIKRLEALEKRVQELDNWKEAFVDHGNPVKANQAVAESATSGERKCVEDQIAEEEAEFYKVKDFMGVENGWRNIFEAIGAKKNDDEIHLPQKDLDSILDEQEKENSEKPNNQDNYPSHWPRKSDGSGVQVFDPIEFKLGTGYQEWHTGKVLFIGRLDTMRIESEKTKHLVNQIVHFDKEMWNMGVQFRFPEEQSKEFDREKALSLLDTIDVEYSDSVSIPIVDKCIEELRQMLGGSDE